MTRTVTKRIPQPVVFPMKRGAKCHPLSRNEYVHILRPCALLFHAGRLYVGYNWLSLFHVGEEPVWDPTPVPLGAVIETCSGYFHFRKILTEGPPYFRKYCELALRYVHTPNDFGCGFLKKEIRQGEIPVCEQFVLPQSFCMEIEWMGCTPFCNKYWVNGRNVERRIRRSPSLSIMREHPEAQKYRRKEHPNGHSLCHKR